jgi:hypothetical protein
MSGTLSRAALAQLRGWGISRRQWVEAHGHEGRWLGDRCGCPDDRCDGFHHDTDDLVCPCVDSLAIDLKQPCPLGDGAFALMHRVRLHTSDFCVLPVLLGDGLDARAEVWRLPRGTAHTHHVEDLPEGEVKPIICIRGSDWWSESCSCRLSPLFWHEYAHALVGKGWPAHGERWQLVRLALEHSALADVLVHREAA